MGLRDFAKKVVGRLRSTEPRPDAPAPAAPAAAPAAPAPKKPATGDKPWFLDGQNDGWDDTNPE